MTRRLFRALCAGAALWLCAGLARAIVFEPPHIRCTFPAPGPPSFCTPLVLRNDGAQTVSITSIEFPTIRGYRFTNGCTAPLTAGNACSVGIVTDPFVPGPDGIHTIVARASDGSIAKTYLTQSVLGDAPPPYSIGVGVGFIDFGRAESRVPPARTIPITIFAAGGGPLPRDSITLQLTDAADQFAIVNTTCPTQIGPSSPAGFQCEASVVFRATSAGEKLARLYVYGSFGNSAYVVLRGEAAGPLADPALEPIPTLSSVALLALAALLVAVALRATRSRHT